MVASLTAWPLPALAADATMQAWGAYLFFAIVATVVIVLLLHEALDDEPTEDQRGDPANRAATASPRRSGPVRYAADGDRTADTRRIA